MIAQQIRAVMYPPRGLQKIGELIRFRIYLYLLQWEGGKFVFRSF